MPVPDDDAVLQIMADFDFKKTARLMHQLGWKWYVGGGVRQVPNEGQIRQQARQLLEQVANNPAAEALSSGGLEARRIGGKIMLRFVAVEARAARRMELAGV
jgi:hypothetical protein